MRLQMKSQDIGLDRLAEYNFDNNTRARLKNSGGQVSQFSEKK